MEVARASKTRPPSVSGDTAAVGTPTPTAEPANGLGALTASEDGGGTAPEEGATVYVLAADNRGQYVIPFPVVF